MRESSRAETRERGVVARCHETQWIAQRRHASGGNARRGRRKVFASAQMEAHVRVHRYARRESGIYLVCDRFVAT